MESQQRAAAVLNEAIIATGGFDTLRGFRTLRQSFTLTWGQVGQGPRPEAEGVQSGPPLTWVLTSDFRSDRELIEIYPPGQTGAPFVRFASRDGNSRLFRIPQKTFVEIPDAQMRTYRKRMTFAPGLLLEAWKNPTSLRYVGVEETDDGSFDVIFFVDTSNALNTLYIDRGTNLLFSSETLVNGQYGPYGDIPSVLTFGEYSREDGVMVPGTIVQTIGPYRMSSATRTEIILNPVFDESLLDTPDDYTAGPDGGGGDDLTVEEMEVVEVADGIYQIYDASPAYHLTFVDSGDYVTVLDALVSPEMGRRLLQKIEEILPGKPVRELVLTHHHFDHSAALITFMANGAKIMATAGNEAFVRRVASAPRVRFDGVSEIVPDIRVVSNGDSFGTGINRFEVYDVGPNHADEILIVFFPNQKLIYVADIYEYNEGTTPPPLLTAFADKMDELDLDFENFIAAHGRPKTAEQFREAVAQARAAPRRGE